ncbi:MAG: hypothetical protein AAF351_13760 [Pseudomonadota bacterium]
MAQTHSISTHQHGPFRLRVVVSADQGTFVQIDDIRRNRPIASWRGSIAERLRRAIPLPAVADPIGGYRCDKEYVQALMVHAAALSEAAKCGAPDLDEVSQRRWHRTRPLRAPLHNRILQTMLDHPGHHFLRDELVCLLLLTFPCIDIEAIDEHLDDIVDWGLAQRIEIDAEHVFFDTNTAPHLHLFNPETRVLIDAPNRGVVAVNSD